MDEQQPLVDQAHGGAIKGEKARDPEQGLLFDDIPDPNAWIDRGAGGRATSKYSKARAVAILEGIRQGNSRTDAAEACGVTKDTLRRWTQRYPWFGQAMVQARAEGTARLLSSIRQAGVSGAPQSWQAAAWILERTRPDDFGQRSRVNISLETTEWAEEVAARFEGVTKDEVLALANATIERELGS